MLTIKTSLPWTLNTNLNGIPVDRHAWPGFKELISYSVAIGPAAGAQKLFTKKFSSKNADSYASMAVGRSGVI
jgi:hypothetical protein